LSTVLHTDPGIVRACTPFTGTPMSVLEYTEQVWDVCVHMHTIIGLSVGSQLGLGLVMPGIKTRNEPRYI